MKPKRVNPCVYAGLMGPVMWAVPQTAFAQTAGQDLDPQTMLVPFAAGLGCGIALAGTVSAIAWHRSKKQLEAESIARAEDAWFGTEENPSYVPQHLRAPGEEAHPFLEEEEQDAGRTLELDREEEKKQERVATEGPRLRSVPTIPAVDADDEPKPPTPPSRPRVSSSETASVSTTMTGGFPVQTAESMPYSSIASRIPDIAASDSPDETTVFLQEVQKKEASRKNARTAQPDAGAHETEDYGDIAENYVQRLNWAERMSKRARGVRSVLSERLAKDSMDDLPVITRADGTVGDVGTDWWEREHGKDISRDLSIPVSDDYSVVQPTIDDMPFAASVTSSQRSFAAEDIAAATTRPRPDRSEISSRIAEIDSGLYPEKEKDGEDKDAMWKAALDALAENDTDAPQAGFTPVVAAPAGLDDDEVFDEPTASLAPQVPDAPSPIDTESYVDYLISDEMSKNPSYARTSRDYLKVIEGGSQKKDDSSAKAKKRSTKLKRLKPRGNRGRSANEA